MRQIVLCRHGETEWSKNGKHTSFTDLDLTDKGREEAARLKEKLSGFFFTHVFSSPLKRALQTCALVGYADPIIEEDLFEWRYGEYEGMTTPEIHKKAPGWNVFTHGAPGGESPEEIESRADRLIDKVLQLEGTVLCFSSGHFSRAFAARWAEFEVVAGKRLKLSTATCSILSFEHDYRVIECWNA